MHARTICENLGSREFSGRREPALQALQRMADMKVPSSVGSEQRGHAQSKNQYFLMSVRRRTLPDRCCDQVEIDFFLDTSLSRINSYSPIVEEMYLVKISSPFRMGNCARSSSRRSGNLT